MSIEGKNCQNKFIIFSGALICNWLVVKVGALFVKPPPPRFFHSVFVLVTIATSQDLHDMGVSGAVLESRKRKWGSFVEGVSVTSNVYHSVHQNLPRVFPSGSLYFAF